MTGKEAEFSLFAVGEYNGIWIAGIIINFGRSRSTMGIVFLVCFIFGRYMVPVYGEPKGKCKSLAGHIYLEN